MAVKKKPPVIEVALDYLRSRLKSGHWKDGDRLPESRQLAALAGVNLQAILKAIGILKREKKIVFKPKVGIYAGKRLPAKPQDVPKNKTPQKWETLKELLTKDILEGRYRESDFLPSVKELADSYGVSSETLQKAIAGLIEEKILTVYKRHYRIGFLSNNTVKKSICLIISENVQNNELYHSFNRNAVERDIQDIERECSARKISLVTRQWSDFRVHDTHGILGFIFCYTLDFGNPPDVMASFLKRFNKPVAVFFPPGRAPVSADSFSA